MLRFNTTCIAVLALTSGCVTSSLADNTNAANLPVGLDELKLKVHRVHNDFNGLNLKGLKLKTNFPDSTDKRSHPLAAGAAPPLSLEEFEAVLLRGGAHSLRGGTPSGGHRTLAPKCDYTEGGTHVCIDDLGDGQCSLTLDGSQCDCCNYDSSGDISAYDCSNIYSTLTDGTCTPPEEEEEEEELGENCSRHDESGSIICTNDLGGGMCEIEIDGDSCNCCNYDTSTGNISAYDCSNVPGWTNDGTCESAVGPDDRTGSGCVPVQGEGNVFRCCDGSNNCVDVSLEMNVV